jgi:hypothetical protein
MDEWPYGRGKTVDSILYHTYTHSDIFFVLVIGNWVIGFFNQITSIDNANYLV